MLPGNRLGRGIFFFWFFFRPPARLLTARRCGGRPCRPSLIGHLPGPASVAGPTVSAADTAPAPPSPGSTSVRQSTSCCARNHATACIINVTKVSCCFYTARHTAPDPLWPRLRAAAQRIQHHGGHVRHRLVGAKGRAGGDGQLARTVLVRLLAHLRRYSGSPPPTSHAPQQRHGPR